MSQERAVPQITLGSGEWHQLPHLLESVGSLAAIGDPKADVAIPAVVVIGSANGRVVDVYPGG